MLEGVREEGRLHASLVYVWSRVICLAPKPPLPVARQNLELQRDLLPRPQGSRVGGAQNVIATPQSFCRGISCGTKAAVVKNNALQMAAASAVTRLNLD